MERTIQFSKGLGKASLRHNNRDFISPNVDKDRMENNVSFINEELGEAYEKIFGEALKEYNAKQKRADRKIDNYFHKLFGKEPSHEIIQGDNKTKSFYEFVVGVGDMHDTGYAANPEAAAKAEKCLKDFINGNEELGIKSFQERNPQLYVFNAQLHADESTPHLHLDFIPFAEGYKKGMYRQQGYDKAIQQMGYKNYGEFCKSERAVLREIAVAHGFEIAEEKESQRVTLPKQAFIEMNQSQRKNEELKKENEQLEKENADLEKENANLKNEIKNGEEKIAENDKQLSQKTAELDSINAQIAELKEQEQESERILEEDEELRRFVQKETEKAKSELAEVQEQTQGAKSELAAVQSELVAAVEIPPRPVEKPLIQKPDKPKDPRTVSGWTKQDYQEYKGVHARWEKECKSIDRQNTEIEKQNALIRQQQAEWDSKYNLLQRVQEVHKEQQRTEEQQSQRAAIQEQNSQKLKKERAELEQEKRTLPQKAQAMAMDILRKMERFTELTKINAAWKQRYEQIFGKAYEERIDNNDRTAIKAEQDVRHGTKPQQPERDS